VRNLASKSREAAQETNALIQESILRVSDGTKRAKDTANSLEQIVGKAVEVADIVARIYEASERQAESVRNISLGISQIAQVVQSNSATSEQSAAASEELNSQAEVLQQMISMFKIR
jgi:methyl-accepting chemotaxis protein